MNNIELAILHQQNWSF